MPTDRHVIARARALLGVRAPVYVRVSRTLRDPTGRALRGRYVGTDAMGAHCVDILAQRGMARVHTIAHEIAHAAQCERMGGWPQFARAYAAESENLEDGAQRAAARVARTIANEMEAANRD